MLNNPVPEFTGDTNIFYNFPRPWPPNMAKTAGVLGKSEMDNIFLGIGYFPEDVTASGRSGNQYSLGCQSYS